MIWFVVFHPKMRWQWWGTRFGHVSLAGYTGGTWIHIDVARKQTEVTAIYKHDEVEDFLAFLASERVVLKFGPARAHGKHFFRPMTCVNFVKHTLGVSCGALRPDSLFHTLIREYDAEQMNEGSKSPPRDAGTSSATAQS